MKKPSPGAKERCPTNRRAMRSTNFYQATTTISTQKPLASAQQCSIRCTSVPKGSALVFHYQPTRTIAIG